MQEFEWKINQSATARDNVEIFDIYSINYKFVYT